MRWPVVLLWQRNHDFLTHSPMIVCSSCLDICFVVRLLFSVMQLFKLTCQPSLSQSFPVLPLLQSPFPLISTQKGPIQNMSKCQAIIFNRLCQNKNKGPRDQGIKRNEVSKIALTRSLIFFNMHSLD